MVKNKQFYEKPSIHYYPAKKPFFFFHNKNPRIAENFTKTIAHSLIPPTLRLVTSTKLNFEAGLLGPRRDKKERERQRKRKRERELEKEIKRYREKPAILGPMCVIRSVNPGVCE